MPHSTSKMRTGHCDNLCIYNIIPRTATKKAIKRDTLKIIIDKSNRLLKMYNLTKRSWGKKGNREMKNRKTRK